MIHVFQKSEQIQQQRASKLSAAQGSNLGRSNSDIWWVSWMTLPKASDGNVFLLEPKKQRENLPES